MTTTFSYAKPFIIANLKAGLTPALLGEPGIGKTAFLENLANELSTKVFVLSVNQLAAKEDLTGARLVPLSNKQDYEQKFYPHQVINQAINYAVKHSTETPILFMDEFNRTESDVTSALFTMITERKIGNKSLPDNLRLCVAGNDSGNVQSIDDASTSRLVIYHMTPDIETLLKTTKLNPYIVKTLQNHSELSLIEHETTEKVETDDEDDDTSLDDFMDQLNGNAESFKQMTTPRTIENLSKELNALNITGQNDQAIINQLLSQSDSFKEILYGISGNTDFTNAVFKTIVDSVTSTAPSTFTLNQATYKEKLTNDDYTLLKSTLCGSNLSDIANNITNLSESKQINLFELLIAPEVVSDIKTFGITDQMIKAGINTLDRLATQSASLKKALVKLIITYANVDYSYVAYTALSNPALGLNEIFSTFA